MLITPWFGERRCSDGVVLSLTGLTGATLLKTTMCILVKNIQIVKVKRGQTFCLAPLLCDER